jgi:DNA invertase Pin-like site-specific DNA recombinase
MIQKAISEEHPYDMILFYDLSRFTRNTRDLLNTLHDLRKAGVQVQSIAQPHSGDPADDEAWIHASASDQAMLPATARKTRDSQFEAVRKGYHPGGIAPFGLDAEDVVIKTEWAGTRGRTRVKEVIHSKLVPNPEEAPYVAEMFDMNNSGKSSTDISEWLIKQGVKTHEENKPTPG